MSISTIELIKERIRSATESSKIAIFKSYRGRVVDVNAVFESTITTRDRINSGCSYYVGSYFGKSGINMMIRDIKGL